MVCVVCLQAARIWGLQPWQQATIAHRIIHLQRASKRPHSGAALGCGGRALLNLERLRTDRPTVQPASAGRVPAHLPHLSREALNHQGSAGARPAWHALPGGGSIEKLSLELAALEVL